VIAGCGALIDQAWRCGSGMIWELGHLRGIPAPAGLG